MVHLLMVRHGESAWNAAGRWQGQADPALSPLGEAQAVAAAEFVPGVDLVVASPLERAVRTATIIAGVRGLGDVVLEHALVERDAGEWSGCTRDEIEAGWPGYLGNGHRPRGYEDDAALLARVLAGLDRVVDVVPADGSALVVCHGGVIYAVEQHLGAPFERIANLAGRWVGITSDGLVLGDRVALLDTSAIPVSVPDLL